MLFSQPFGRNIQLSQRRFRKPGVQSIGYASDKEYVVKHAFETFNYSLILSGAGFHAPDGNKVPLSTPCVLTQFPGKPTWYGPVDRQTWEELYLIFPASCVGAMLDRGLIGPEPAMWPIRNVGAVHRAARTLRTAIDAPEGEPGYADRIDLLVEALLIETLLPGYGTPSDPGSAAVTEVVSLIHTSPSELCDFAAIARRHGLSYSTFQRRWREFYDDPPGQYHLNYRISVGCRLLAESALRVVDVAEQTGFEDPAYFSRTFRQRIGLSPSQFKALHNPERRGA